MATEAFVLDARIKGFQKFLQESEQLDKQLMNIAAQAEKTVKTLNNIKIKPIDLNIGEIPDGNKLDPFVKSLRGLSKLSLDAAATDIERLMQALGRGAQAKTIQNKGEALKIIVTQFRALSKLGDISPVTTDLTTLLTVLQSSGGSFNAASKAFGNIVKVFQQLASLKGVGITQANLTGFDRLVELFRTLQGLDLNRLSANLGIVTKSISELIPAIRGLAGTKNAEQIPKVLRGIAQGIQLLIQSVSASNIQGNINNIVDAISKFGIAAENLGKGFSKITNLGLSTEITSKIDALNMGIRQLAQTFTNFSTDTFVNDLQNISKAFAALTKATASLVNQKNFDKLGDRVEVLIESLRQLAQQDFSQLEQRLSRIGPLLEQLSSASGQFTKLQNAAAAANRLHTRTISESRASMINYRAALLQVGAAILQLTPSIARLSLTLLKLPIKAVTLSLKALKTAFITLPIKAVTGLFKILSGAIRIIVNAFNGVVNALVRVDVYFLRLKRALKVLLTPFNAIITLVRLLTNAITGLISKLTGGTAKLLGFNRAAKTTEQTLAQSTKNSEMYAQSFQRVGKEAQSAQPKIQAVSSSTEKVGIASTAATSGMQLLLNVLAARGITLAVKRFVSLQVALRALDRIGGTLNLVFSQLSHRLRSVVQEGFEAAATFENLRRQFTALSQRELVQSGQFDSLGAAAETAKAKAEELLETFRLMAFQSPFNRDDLAQVFGLAQTFGFAGEEGLALTQILVDFAAATGQSGEVMKGIITALSQMKANTTVAKEELNQLAERGVPAIQILTNAFNQGFQEGSEVPLLAAQALEKFDEEVGFTAKNILDLTSRGLIPANFAIGAIAQSLGTDFAGQAKQATTSLSGLLATFQDFRANTLREFFQGSFDALRPLVAEMLSLESMDNALAATRELGEALGKSVGENAIRVLAAIKAFREIIASIPAPVKSTIAQIIQFGAILASVTVALGLFQAISLTLATTLGLFVNPITIIIGGFAALTVAIVQNRDTIATAIENIRMALASLPNIITSTVVPLFSSGFQAILNIVSTSANTLSQFFGEMLTSVAEWGSALVESFANGIIAAVQVVADAMSAIGNMIAYWLAPGSPPRILPDIDKWGEQAAQEYLDGFTKADFNFINEFADNIEQAINSVGADVELDAITQNFASILGSFNAGEGLNTAAFVDLQEEIGGAGSQIGILVNKYVELAARQSELNRLTEEYETTLGGVNTELNELDATETFEKEQKQLTQLNKQLRNRFLTENDRASIERNIQRIQLERRKREIELAKERAQSLVNETKDQIAVNNERLKIAKKFSDEESDILAAGSGIGSAATGKAPKIKTPKVQKIKPPKIDLDELKANLGAATKEIEGLEFTPPVIDTSSISATGDRIQEVADNIKSRFEIVGTTFTNLRTRFDNITTSISTAIDNIKGKFMDFGVTSGHLRIALISLGVAIGGVAIALSAPALLAGLGAITAGLVAIFNPITLAIAGIAGLGTALVLLIQKTGSFEGAVHTIKAGFDILKNLAIENIFDPLIIKFDILKDKFSIDIFGTLSDKLSNLRTFFTQFEFPELSLPTLDFGSLTFESPDIEISDSSGLISDFVDNFNRVIIEPAAQALANNSTILATIRDLFINVYSSMAREAIDALGSVTDTINISNFLDTTAIGQFIEKEFSGLFGGVDLSDAINSIIETFNSIIGPIQYTFDAVVNIITDSAITRILEENRSAFAEFFAEISSPEFLSAVGSIVAALAGIVGAFLGISLAIADLALIGVLRNIADIIIGVVDGIKLAISGFVQIASGDLTGFITVLQGVSDVFTAVFDGLSNIISDSILALLKFIGIDISQTFSLAIPFIGTFTLTIEDAVKSVTKIAVAIATFGRSLLNLGIRAITSVSSFTGLTRILSKLQPVVAVIGTAFGVLAAIGRRIVSVFNTIKNLFIGLFDNIGSTDEATGLFASILDIARPLLNVIRILKNTLSNLFAGLAVASNFLPSIESVKMALTDLKDFVIGLFTNPIGIQFGIPEIPTAFVNLTDIAAKGLFISTIFTEIALPVWAELLERWESGDISISTVLDDITIPESIQSFIDFVTEDLNITTVLDDITIPESMQNFIDFITGDLNIKAVLDDITYPPTLQSLIDFVSGDNSITATITNFDVPESLQTVIDFITGEQTINLTLPELPDLTSLTTAVDSLKELNTLSFQDTANALSAIFTGEGSVTELLQAFVTDFLLLPAQLVLDSIAPFAPLISNINEAIGLIDTVQTTFQSVKDFISSITFDNPFSGLQDQLDGIIGQIESTVSVLNIIPGVNIDTGENDLESEIQNSFETAIPDTVDAPVAINLSPEETELRAQAAATVQTYVDELNNSTVLEGVGNAGRRDAVIDIIDGGVTPEDIKAVGNTLGIGFNEGVIEGLSSEDRSTAVAARNEAIAILDAAKEALGIESPSTLARDEIGLEFDAGIAEGIDAGSAIVTTSINNLLTTLISTANDILASLNLGQTISNLLTPDSGAISQIRSFTTTIISQYRSLTITIIPVLRSFSNNAVDSFEDLYEDIIELSEDFFEELLNLFRNFVDDAIAEIQRLANEVIEEFERLVEDSLDALRDFDTEIIELFENIAEEVIDIVAQLVDNVVSEFERLIPAVVNVLNNLRSAINSALDSITAAFVSGAAAAVSGFISELSTITSQTLAIIVNLIDSILVFETQFENAGLELGGALIGGIIEGINLNRPVLNQVLSSAVQEAVEAAEEAAGIASPSKLTRDRIGKHLPSGIAVGITDNAYLISDALSGVVSNAILNNEGNSLSSLFNNLTPAQQPVELQYNNLLTGNLPTLYQGVDNNRLRYNLRQGIMQVVAGQPTPSNITSKIQLTGLQALESKEQLATLMPATSNPATINTNNSSNVSSIRNTYQINNQYTMNVKTTESRATRRVSKNFRKMQMANL